MTAHEFQSDVNTPPKIKVGDATVIIGLDPKDDWFSKMFTVIDVRFSHPNQEWYAQCLSDDGQIFEIWSPDNHLKRIE